VNGVLQSGQVTPTHIITWTTDGVIQDGGVSIPAISAMLASIVTGINFNSANTDNPISIGLPPGYTRYRIHQILLSGATASLSTATCGVFTQQAAAGTAVVTTGTAITVTQTAGDTNGNMQSFTINDQNTMALIDTTLYFRVQNANGSPGLGNVAVFYQPMP
jgi:uncharacterized membrane protein YphA (DoxX/SURF4 family)